MKAELTNLTGERPIRNGRVVFSDGVAYLFFKVGPGTWDFQTLNPAHRKMRFRTRGKRLAALRRAIREERSDGR